MSEFVWYSRLVVLVGALILFAQAASGRAPSVLTLFAILCVSVGLVAFLTALIMTGDPAATAGLVVESATQSSSREPPTQPHAAAPSPESEALSQQPPQARAAEPPSRVQPAEAPESYQVITEVVKADRKPTAPCVVCSSNVQPGQVSAHCPVCRQIHHAACWVENGFRCGRGECSGSGNLQAPKRE